MTTEELQALIDEWVELYIQQLVAFRTGQKATPDRINELFNLLITQGDDTAQTVAHIRDYLRQYKIERNEQDVELKAYLDNILAAVQADNALTKSEMSTLKNTVERYRDETVAILEPMFEEIKGMADGVAADVTLVSDIRADIEEKFSVGEDVINSAADVIKAVDNLRIQINLMPIDGGTFFDTYPEWNVDGGQFDS